MAYDAGVFVQIDSKDGTNHLYLCTCSANIDAKELVGGVSTRTYLSGYILSEIQVSGSMDISGGWGGLAAASDCSIEIADDDSGTLAKGILDDSWGLVGGLVSVAHRTPDGVMHPLYQFVVTEPGLNEDGSIAIVSKTPSATRLEMMHKSIAVSQLLTGPDDPANPTDPDYLQESSANVTAGTAFGGVSVSLKAGAALPVCRIAYRGKSKKGSGRIVSSVMYPEISEGRIISVNATRMTRQTLFPSGNVKSIGVMMFDCRGAAKTFSAANDHTEQNRLADEIQSFIDKDYKIILSNGTWYLDVTSNIGAVAEFYPALPTSDAVVQYTEGKTWGKYDYILGNPDSSLLESNVGIWFALSDGDLEEVIPPDGVDPESVGIFAVPKNIPVASAQYVIDGVAKNGKTFSVEPSTSIDDGILLAQPLLTTDSGIATITRIDPSLQFALDAPESPWLKHDAIEWKNPLLYWDGGGTIDDIKTSPSNRWDGGAVPVEIALQPSIIDHAGRDAIGRLRCSSGSADKDSDFYCADSTWLASYTYAAGHSGEGTYRLFVKPFFNGVEKHVQSFFKAASDTVGRTLSATHTAAKSLKKILWQSYAASLSDLKDGTPQVRVNFDSTMSGVFVTLKLQLMELFLWGFSRIGFSSIYSTVYPFWTRANCARLAYGAGTIIAGGVGRGTEIQPNGAITWATFDLPVPFGGVATVTGTAYGTIGSASYWASVGYITTGATQTPACWISDDDGVTWRQDASYQTTSIPTAFRYVNGQFVATRTDGKIDIVVGFSYPNLIWSEVATGATQLNDIAFGTGYYLLVGNGGQARYTSNLSSFVSWPWSGGDDLTCVCYSQSSAGGYFHVGVNSETVGTIYRKYDGTLPDWTAAPIPGGYSITAIMDSNGDVVAMGPAGVWARSPGYPDATWKLRASIGGNTEPVGGVAFSVGGTDLLVVGANAQILTSPTFYQGASAGSAIPEWTPWGTKTPWDAMDHLICQKLGGKGASWNPVKVSGRSPIYQEFGIAFPPPDNATDKASGTTVREAAAKICKEWWLFAGDMPAAKLDGSADAIQAALPDVKLGNREDVCTQITAQYQPFGGDYLGKAYIQNVDKAYTAGNDAFYFGGWDLPGANTFGLLLWQRCRDAYLATGILRDASLTFDSVQGPATLGALWAMEDQDLGERILWLCRQPRYYKITVDGNESAAALAFPGCRYKPNPLLLSERGLSLGITGYGLVVEASHDPINAAHTLTIAFPPEQPA